MIITHFPLFLNSKGYEKIIVENWIRPKYLDLRMIGTWLEGTYKSYFLVYLFSGSLEKKSFQKASVSLFDKSCFEVVRATSLRTITLGLQL